MNARSVVGASGGMISKALSVSFITKWHGGPPSGKRAFARYFSTGAYLSTTWYAILRLHREAIPEPRAF